VNPFDPFAAFAASLTPDERVAIERWQGVHYESLRWYQLTGEIPCGSTAVEMAAFEHAFSSALRKAVVCREPVFRGLSAGRWRPERIDYLFSLVSGTSEIVLRSHDSASRNEARARDWCFLNPADKEERHLAVFLRITPLSARYLAPFLHQAGDEEEVILLKGTIYERISARQIPSGRDGLDYWEIELVEQVV
jgi:hypothetical protein